MILTRSRVVRDGDCSSAVFGPHRVLPRLTHARPVRTSAASTWPAPRPTLPAAAPISAQVTGSMGMPSRRRRARVALSGSPGRRTRPGSSAERTHSANASRLAAKAGPVPKASGESTSESMEFRMAPSDVPSWVRPPRRAPARSSQARRKAEALVLAEGEENARRRREQGRGIGGGPPVGVEERARRHGLALVQGDPDLAVGPAARREIHDHRVRPGPREPGREGVGAEPRPRFRRRAPPPPRSAR